jgi:hypothetical protein
MTLRTADAADVSLAVRWSRWLSMSGPACIERRGDTAMVRFSGPGTAVLSSSLRPKGHC